MATKEQIAVMEHFERGGEVEYSGKNKNIWSETINPIWYFAKLDYRAKEEPTYYYKWKKLSDNSKQVKVSNFVDDEPSATKWYINDGWTRIESSKMTFDEIV